VTLLIAVMLLRLGSNVSMVVVILLGTLRMGHLMMSYVTVRMVAILQVP
jgi:hypothetical protein